MLQYSVRRLVQLLPPLLLLSLGVFLLTHFIPGDPVLTMLGENATTESVSRLRHELGLDRPLPLQYASWLANLLKGNLGTSIVTGYPVAETVLERFPVTLTLALFASLVSIIVAIPAGILAATNRNTIIDYAILLGTLIGISVPSFVVGILMILFFSVRLGWFPAVGYTPFTENFLAGLHSMTLPAIALGLLFTAVIARMMRATMLEVISQDFVRTARAKGVTERKVEYSHALRNALIPVVTVIGINFAQLLGGTVIIESVFSLPGLGTLVVSAISSRDYPVVQAVILLVATAFLLVNIVVDLICGLLDPRIRYE